MKGIGVGITILALALFVSIAMAANIEPTGIQGNVAHGIEGIGDHDEDALGGNLFDLATTDFMIFALVARRSSLLIPGFRGMPAVITTISDPAAGL